MHKQLTIWLGSIILLYSSTMLHSALHNGKTYSSLDCNGIPLDHKLIEIINIENGVFIEVGAYDGVWSSNTKLLEECYGWTGILIEPSEQSFKQLQENRPLARCFQCALGSFKEDGSYAQGDFDGGAMASLVGRTDRPRTHTVHVRSLQSVLDECAIDHVHFFSLDTEGYELNILKGIDFTKTTFDYILIEIYNHQYSEIVSLLSSQGYELVTCLSNYNKDSNPGWDGTHNDYLFKRTINE
jgi:FkbM family methyltransferase